MHYPPFFGSVILICARIQRIVFQFGTRSAAMSAMYISSQNFTEKMVVLKALLPPTCVWRLSVHRATIKVIVSVFGTSFAFHLIIKFRTILVQHLRLVLLPADQTYERDIYLAPSCCRSHWVNGHLALEQ